jgi:PAS domain S-box-containing protein
MAAAIEFSGEAIIASTLEGVITTWNPAAERLFGYSTDEIVGKSDTLLLPGGRTRELRDVMARVALGERVVNYETIRARKDGSVFPISLTMTPIYDAHGKVIGASSTPRDITGQKEAVAAAQHLAAIVEFSADAIISYTLEGAVTSWNPAAERMFGYTSHQIIGKSIEQLSPEGRTGEISSIMAMVKAGRPVEHQETLRVRKDGTEVRVSLTVSPIRGAEGTILGLSAIARDMTERT